MATPRLRQDDSNVRARRVSPALPFVVEAKTIGAPMVYAMPVDNASRSGLLLSAGRNRKVPYRVNTLLELSIDPHGVAFERPVACVGKIVRVAKDEEARPIFGVQIVQIETRDAAAWDKAMEALEAAQAMLLPESEPPAAA